MVHLITIKPVLLGGIASLFFPKISVVTAITGLGYLYISTTIKSKAIKFVVGILYKLALSKKKLVVIFQNSDDRDEIEKLKRLSVSKIRFIKGSGVDLNQYYFSSLPKGIPVVMFASRLLVDKGVREFVKAARMIQQKQNVARFVLVGNIDTGNLASISKKELTQWTSRE